MFEDNDGGSIDDLFGDGDTPDAQVKQRCTSCGTEFSSEEVVARFCSACGTPLNPKASVGEIRVLLAEDAIVSRQKITAVLRRLGCVVSEAVNGREAVGLAHQINPHLIILDVHMPDQNGLEALDILRAEGKFKNTRIVMVTGEADASIVKDALARGANDYIRKGSSTTELQQRLNRHVQNIRIGG